MQLVLMESRLRRSVRKFEDKKVRMKCWADRGGCLCSSWKNSQTMGISPIRGPGARSSCHRSYDEFYP